MVERVDGVLVNSVAPSGPSFGKLRKGDVITEMGFSKIASLQDAYDALEPSSAAPGRPLLVRVSRAGQTMFFTIETER